MTDITDPETEVPSEETPPIEPVEFRPLITLVIDKGKVVAEVQGTYYGPMESKIAPPNYVLGSFIDDELPDICPERVTRASGILALKRHYLSTEMVEQPLGESEGEGEAPVLVETKVLKEVPPDQHMDEGTLFHIVESFRLSLPLGLDRDKVDIAFTSTLHWLRYSATVAVMAAVIPLTQEQLDQLFIWAGKHEDLF